MVEETLAVPKKEATDYTPLPDDMYQVELLDVTAKSSETYDSKKARQNDPSLAPEMETVLDFQFTVLEDGEFDGKPLRGRNIWQNFVPSYLYIGKKGKNDLYKIVEACQGEGLTPQQEAFGITGKEINALIGKQCRVVTKQITKNGKTFMDVENFLPAKMQLAPLTAEEKEEARVKPKDAEAEKRADAAFDGTSQTTEPPFPNN